MILSLFSVAIFYSNYERALEFSTSLFKVSYIILIVYTIGATISQIFRSIGISKLDNKYFKINVKEETDGRKRS